MKITKLPILLGVFVIVLSILACGGSVSTANIGDAWMSSDEEGNSRAEVFAQDAVFYAQVDLRNAPDDTKLKAVWSVVDAEDTEPNLVITETELVGGSGVVHFVLSNTNLWPIGTYKVEIYLDDPLAETLEFEVR